MNTKRTAFLVVIGTVLLGLTLSAPSFAADRATDSDITFWVKSALRQDERVDASRITVAMYSISCTLREEADGK